MGAAVPQHMQGNWIRIIEQAGDSHLGATLVRLARRAAAMHGGEADRRAGRVSRDRGEATVVDSPEAAPSRSPLVSDSAVACSQSHGTGEKGAKR